MNSTATLAPPRSSLTVIVNKLRGLADSYLAATEREASFDGGEWSGPALERGLRTAVAAALREHGWTAPAFLDEVTARTSPRWLRLAALDELVDVVTCSRCGTRELVVDSFTADTAYDPTAVSVLACGHHEL